MKKNLFIDYYEDLQVSPNADMETIERIYRLFAKRYHPDNSISGDAEKFNVIAEAYRLLSDPEKRGARCPPLSGKQPLLCPCSPA